MVEVSGEILDEFKICVHSFVKDGLVDGFCLAVALRISASRLGKSYLPLLAECLESGRDELRPVVCHDFVTDPVSGDYVLPYKVLDLYVFDTCVGICLNPF